MVGDTPGIYISGGVGMLIALLAPAFHHLRLVDIEAVNEALATVWWRRQSGLGRSYVDEAKDETCVEEGEPESAGTAPELHICNFAPASPEPLACPNC